MCHCVILCCGLTWQTHKLLEQSTRAEYAQNCRTNTLLHLQQKIRTCNCPEMIGGEFIYACKQGADGGGKTVVQIICCTCNKVFVLVVLTVDGLGGGATRELQML